MKDKIVITYVQQDWEMIGFFEPLRNSQSYVFANSDDIDTLQKKNLELTAQYNGLRTELTNILDSKGWKLMEKIRKIKPKKKK